jgi:thymidylate synthase
MDNINNSIPDHLFGSGTINNKVSDNIFAHIAANTFNSINSEEQQYLDLIQNILDNGSWEHGRNGRTKSIFGHSMRFSLADGKIPILTTKKTAWKTCLKELIWFIRGETDNKLLVDQGVHIWDGNSSREFLDSVGLQTNPEGILGPIYGRQWRNFNAPYDNQRGELLDNENKGIDQLQQIIEQLKDPIKRNSRRLILTAWNPCQLDQMALPPCHILCQFNVHDGNKLSCSMYQRSNDEACGTSINIASYSFLTHLLAKHCGLEAYEFVYFKGNCHIYEDHIEGMKTQITRKPYQFPTVSIEQIRENINDYQVEDFKIYNYQHHEAIKFQMVA